MLLRVCHLIPITPLHLGEAAGAMDRVSVTVPSDTLFSGICHAWLRLFGVEGLEKLIQAFSDEPPFLISSGFPVRLDGGSPVYFLPAPKGKELFLEVETGKNAVSVTERELQRTMKRLAKLAYIDLDFYSKYFIDVGKRPSPDEIEDQERRASNCIGKYIKISSALCRSTMAAVPFPVALVRPAEGWGYYLVAFFRDEETEKNFEAALRLLGDMGLGGDRTYGYGAFRVERGDESSFVEIVFPGDGQNGNAALEGRLMWVNLSLVFPEKETRASLAGSYLDILERKGWVYSPVGDWNNRRNRLRMIREGSLLTVRPRGRLVDVTPNTWRNHKVYRYGFGVYAPVRANMGV